MLPFKWLDLQALFRSRSSRRSTLHRSTVQTLLGHSVHEEDADLIYNLIIAKNELQIILNPPRSDSLLR